MWTRIFTVVLLTGIGSIASARTISVLPLKIYAEGIDETKAQHVFNLIKKRLAKYKKYKLMTTPQQDPLDMILEAGFTDLNAESLAGIGKQWQADKVMYTEIKSEGGTHSLYMMVVDVKTKRSAVAELKLPSLDQPEATVISIVTELFGPLPKPAPPVATIEITTIPAEAEVYLDGRYLGHTPIHTNYPPGTYTLTVKRTSFKPVEKKITLQKGKKYTYSFRLERILLPKVPVPGKARPRAKKEKKFYQTWWFWTTVGVVVAGGVTTAAVLLSRVKSTPTGSFIVFFDPGRASQDSAIKLGAEQ